MNTSSHCQVVNTAHASRHTHERIAYKRELQMTQFFADLDRRLKGKKKVADELCTYLFD